MKKLVAFKCTNSKTSLMKAIRNKPWDILTKKTHKPSRLENTSEDTERYLNKWRDYQITGQEANSTKMLTVPQNHTHVMRPVYSTNDAAQNKQSPETS